MKTTSSEFISCGLKSATRNSPINLSHVMAISKSIINPQEITFCLPSGGSRTWVFDTEGDRDMIFDNIVMKMSLDML